VGCFVVGFKVGFLVVGFWVVGFKVGFKVGFLVVGFWVVGFKVGFVDVGLGVGC
jgi:hypothetical protein